MHRLDFDSIAVRVTATAVAAVLLAACGGGGGNPGVTSASTSGASGTSGTSGTGTSGSSLPSLPAPSTPSTGAAGNIAVSTTLSGAQEVPPNTSGATGTGNISVDTSTGNFTATITTNGITGTAAHIHQGAQGVSGPVVFPLTQTVPGGNTWTTSGKMTSTQISTLTAGQFYFNVHSATYPAGEIRGQILLPQNIIITPPTTPSSGGTSG